MPHLATGAPLKSRRLILGALLLGGLGVLASLGWASYGTLPEWINPPGPPQTELLTETFQRSGSQFHMLAQRGQSAPRRFNRHGCAYAKSHELYLLAWREGETTAAQSVKICDLTPHGVCGGGLVKVWWVGVTDPPVIAVLNGDHGSGYSLTFWNVGASQATLLSKEAMDRSLKVSPDGTLGVHESPRGSFQLRRFPSLQPLASISATRVDERRIFTEGHLTNSGKILLNLDYHRMPVFSGIWLDVVANIRTPVQIKAPPGESVELEAVVDLPEPDSLQLRIYRTPSGPWRQEWRSAMGEKTATPAPDALLSQIRGTRIPNPEFYRAIPDGRSQITFSTVNPAGESVPVTLRLPW